MSKPFFNQASLIALTEIWLKPLSNLSTWCPDTYENTLTCSRQKGKIGGVGFMRRDNVKMQTFKVTNLLFTNSNCKNSLFLPNHLHNSLI